MHEECGINEEIDIETIEYIQSQSVRKWNLF